MLVYQKCIGIILTDSPGAVNVIKVSTEQQRLLIHWLTVSLVHETIRLELESAIQRQGAWLLYHLGL